MQSAEDSFETDETRLIGTRKDHLENVLLVDCCEVLAVPENIALLREVDSPELSAPKAYRFESTGIVQAWIVSKARFRQKLQEVLRRWLAGSFADVGTLNSE